MTNQAPTSHATSATTSVLGNAISPTCIALLLLSISVMFTTAAHGEPVKGKPAISAEAARKSLADIYTPGMFLGAAQRGETELVKVFLDAEMDINTRVRGSGDTALMLAAGSGRTETVKSLLARGADVNIRNDNGDTALSKASSDVTEPKKEIVRMLVEKGAK